MQSDELCQGDEVLITGPTTGVIEMTANDIGRYMMGVKEA